MSSFCSNNNFDNNVLVLDMVLSSLWGVPQAINWDDVAKLVPGFTPKECAQRFEELKNTGVLLPNCNVLTGGSSLSHPDIPTYTKSTLLLDTEEPEMMIPGTNQSSRSGPGLKMASSGRGGGAVETVSWAPSSAKEEDRPQDGLGGRHVGYNMVIHVCDEAKDVKQDFVCPRELLVKEMRYFAEYLSHTQRWEEVDISVHCDVQIFHWLMNYVKRNISLDGSSSKEDQPKLEPSNVISILISSQFLKMDTLVEDCIQYCYKHMSAIVAMPCNMNSISNDLVARISDLFDHNDADNIKDKKDKFKSRLFQTKIVRLFDPDYDNPDSPGSAATLYRCGLCLKLLTKDVERKTSCVPGKFYINPQGNIAYTHTRQKSWEVHEYLTALHEELKSWVLVYWRIWGTVNHLTCSCCQQVFACAELSHCRYHPETVLYSGLGVEPGWRGGAGVYPCCNLRVLRFDPTGMPTGCKMRDHIVSGDCSDHQVNTRLLNDLILHRDTVCVPHTQPPEGSVESPSGDRALLDCDILLEPPCLLGGEGGAFSRLKNWSLQLRQQSLLSEDEETTTGSEVTEDEVGDEEEMSKKQAAKKAKKSRRPMKRQVSSPNFQHKEKAAEKNVPWDMNPFLASGQKIKWDNSRSMRYNQDAQREEDQRRMVEIIGHLTKMRFGDQEQSKSKDIKEHAGGIYSRLEAQFRSSSQTSSRQSGSEKTARPKGRATQLRPT